MMSEADIEDPPLGVFLSNQPIVELPCLLDEVVPAPLHEHLRFASAYILLSASSLVRLHGPVGMHLIQL